MKNSNSDVDLVSSPVVAPEGWNELPVSPSVREPFPDRPAASKSGKVAISIPIDESGNPQFDKLRESSAAKLKELLKNPATQAFIGGEEVEVTPAPKELVDAAIDTFFRMEALVFAARMKVSPAQAMAYFQLSKAEHEKIDPLAQRVLGKRLPGWLLAYGDEISLAWLLANATMAKYTVAKSVVDSERNKNKVVESPKTEESKTADPVYLS